MKKTRMIIMTFAVAMILMGSAYAAWTQSIEVESTVNTGALEATVNSVTLESDHTSSDENLAIYTPNVSQTGALGENISISMSNYYPGIEDTFKFEVENTGTIPMDIKIEDVVNGLPWGVNYLLQPETGVYGNGTFTQISAGSMGWTGSRAKAPSKWQNSTPDDLLSWLSRDPIMA